MQTRPNTLRRWMIVVTVCALSLTMLAAIVPAMAQGAPPSRQSLTLSDPVFEIYSRAFYSMSVDPPTSALFGDAGGSVTHTFRVTNTTTAPVSVTTTVSGGKWPADVFLDISGTVSLSLPAGGGANIWIVVHIPADAAGNASDAATLCVMAQSGGPCWGSATLTTMAFVRRGVRLDLPAHVGVRAPGELVQCTLHVTNTGNITDTFNLTATAPPGWGRPELDLLQATLGAGDSQALGVTFTVGSKAVSGTAYSVFITAATRFTMATAVPPSVYTATRLTLVAGAHRVYLPMILQDWPPTWIQGGIAGQTVYHISVCPTDPSRLYAGVGTGVPNDNRGQVYRTIDAGQSWLMSLNNGQVRGTALNPRDCRQAYVPVWGQGVFKTTNGGDSWQAAGELREPYAYAVAVDPRPAYSQTVYVGLARYGMDVSVNGGATWTTTVLTDAAILGIAVTDNGSVYVATWGKGVYRVHDNTAQPLGDLSGAALSVFAVAIDPGSPAVLYAATDGGLYRSGDSGAHWNQVLTGRVFSVMVDPSTSQRVYAGVNEGGVWYSEDGGVSFKALANGMPSNLTVRHVVIGPNTSRYIHAGTTDGAWRYPR